MLPRQIPTLTDGVVTLRAPQDGDAPDAVEQSRDPVSRQWTTVPVPYDLEDARRYLRHLIPGGWESDTEWGFVVEATDPDTGAARFAGSVSLRNHGGGRAEVAYGSHPWARGRGLMRRAVRLLLEWGFAEREVRTVLWLAYRGNWASRRLAWSLGFHVEGSLRKWVPQREELRDAWVGTLLHGDPMAPATPWLDVPVIVGADLVLRPAEETDLPRIVEGRADPMSARWLRTGAPGQSSSLSEAARELLHVAEQSAAAEAMTWVAADPRTDQLLGQVSLFALDQHHDAGCLGYWVHPDARGRGVATQAARLAVRHGFVDIDDGGLGLRRLSAWAGVENSASRRVLERLGFTHTGVSRASLVRADGSAVDEATYDLLATEYRSH